MTNLVLGKKPLLSGTSRKNLSAWLIMLPAVILFAFFVWIPLLENVRLSLSHTTGVTTTGFAGLENFGQLFNDPDFWPALRNTLFYVLWSLVIGFWVPIIMAVFITEVLVWKGIFKVGVYFPNILPGVAVVMLGGFFLRPGETGVLNILIGGFGVPPQPWLTAASHTIPLIVVLLTWKAAGSTSLIYMAALGNIRGELYEAATIDGAGPFRRFLHITLPSILNLGKTLLILQIISVFQILYEPLILTNGGPNNASISIMQLVWKYAFRDFNYPKAAALSMLICVILIVLTLIYFRVTKRFDK